MKKSLENRQNRNTTAAEFEEMNLKPIPEKNMPKWAKAASQAHRRATKKKRVELRQRGLPMIIWKDGKVCEVPACIVAASLCRGVLF
jgi:hypothetical protein